MNESSRDFLIALWLISGKGAIGNRGYERVYAGAIGNRGYVKPMSQTPVHAKIRRLYVPDANYFITFVFQNRASILADPQNMALFRATLRTAKEYHPFTMRAYVFLADHLHLLIFIPTTTNISKLMQSVQRNFTRNYKAAHGIPQPIRLWQRGFWDHVIRNEQDFANHFHYIHFNPVKHGYVTRPTDYPYSSFHEYYQRGWYTADWGATQPDEIAHLSFE